MSDGQSLEEKIAAALERLSQAQRVLAQDAATAHGLSPIQLRILDWLTTAPGSHARPSAIAKRFDLTAPTVTDAVGALVRKGLVQRRETATDARGVAISLTSAGQALTTRTAGWNALLERAIDALDQPSKQQLLSSLFMLIASLQRAGVITIARMCVTCQHFRPDAHADQSSPHHCALLDLPLAEPELRIDCPDHQQRPAA